MIWFGGVQISSTATVPNARPASLFWAAHPAQFCALRKADNTPPDTIDPQLVPMVIPLLRLRQPVDPLPAQLIHGDLNEENILVAPGIPPAIIDFTPYWHPPEFALAVLAYWLGPARGDMTILGAFTQVRAFDQMLVRAALRMIFITHEFSELGGSLEHVVEEFQTPVRIIVEWMRQRERQ